MKIIAISTPKVTDDDASIIKQILERGINIIHLRKPESNINECRKLLEKLNIEQRKKIIIHDHPELYFEFSLKGIHTNRNITILPSDYTGFKTRSCHSLEEILKHKSNYDYLFLSPIFDSISKSGYKSGFNHKELQKASEEGIIDKKVIALGGITPEKIDYLKKLNFGGVAGIGSFYRHF
ncbi:MAG: thiamine phosphate synthase [Paludibacteraceae bacterium]|jgi:thiamine-phosphate pyrophosphorylase|nr:thiamine phosphate synthase [Paludibacteraceae bacterium]